MTVYSERVLLDIERRACQLRCDSIEMIHQRKAGHPGGSLSCAEILAALYFQRLCIDPKRPGWRDRDRFILSKGHASAILYAALARRGFFPLEDLKGWGALNCHLQGHPDRVKTPGVDMTTGILGHGVAIGAGWALAARLNNQTYRIYVLLGDGECQGGIVWEGALMAAKYRLSNMTAIVDYNDVQLAGPVHSIMPLEPLADKWRAYNWAVIEINGHNTRQILEALDMAEEIHHQPTVILAHTTKGKGVSFMENQSCWHGVPPNDNECTCALEELREGMSS